MFSFLISRMVNMGIVNAILKFENQILSYKQGTEFEIVCFENKAEVLFYWYNW